MTIEVDIAPIKEGQAITVLWRGKPVKNLTEGKKKTGGRNNTGRIVVRWQGGGHSVHPSSFNPLPDRFGQPVRISTEKHGTGPKT